MKRFPVLIAVLVFSLMIPALTLAGTINVPADYTTIQAAIDAAGPGDTVQVAAGTYNEDITLKSGVIVQGAGASVTTIQGTGTTSVITAINVAPSAMIDGFTITNGYSESPDPGGGIYLYNSSPTISSNIITGNHNGYPGGGITCHNSSSPLIDNNIITGNSTILAGGIHIAGSSPTISRNDITDNIGDDGIRINGISSPIIDSNNISGNVAATHPINTQIVNAYSYGQILIINNKIEGKRGLELLDDSYAIITNNTFIGQDASPYESTGITILGSVDDPSTMIFTNNIVWGFDSSIYNLCSWKCVVSVTHSCYETVYGGAIPIDNNILDDPKFVDAAGGDYHLQPDSPCIDNGSNAAVPSWLTTDLDGKPRIWNGTVDIGAYENVPEGATPEGDFVEVIPAPTNPMVPGTSVDVTFADVTAAGTTTVTTSQDGAPPPEGFSLGDPPVTFDIQTTASYDGLITVCINYTGISFDDESKLRLFHQNEDVTISLDTGDDIICGVVSSLSPFAILEPSYQFVGFFDPVQTGEGVVNLAKAGGAIPVKWQLQEESGGFIDDLSVVTGINVSERECEDSSLLTDLGEPATSGNSGLRYDYASNQFIYNWKSTKNMAGNCYRLNVELFGFEVHWADFQMW